MGNGKSKLTVVLLAGAMIASVRPTDAEDLDAVFSFETTHGQNTPAGWSGGPVDTLGVDESVSHQGRWSGRISRAADSSQEFSSLTKSLPADIEGSRLTLKAWVRSRGVDDFFGLWIRQDGLQGPVEFDNNYWLGLKGDQEWREIYVSTDLSAHAKQIIFGLALGGAGTVWIDDVQLLVDDQPYSQTPKSIRAPLPWESDTEFDAGSGIGDLELTAMQVESIATLIEIWGFVKYHHPGVAAGNHHFDYELFRVLPRILAAESGDERNRALLAWVIGLGSVDPCTECASLPNDVHLDAPIDWIRDTERLGGDLSAQLQSIYDNRPADGGHIFVSHAAGVGNPEFKGEMAYPDLETVDAGFRLLALARLWNIVRYWSPYRDLTDTPWPEVLRTAIPRLFMPLDKDDYAREMIRAIAEIRDTHANLWGSLHVRPPGGSCVLDAGFRFVEGEAVVWALLSPNTTELEVGDVLIELDGQAVKQLVDEWSPYFAASNMPTRLRDIGRKLSVGPCGKSHLRVRRNVDGEDREVNLVAERKERDKGTALETLRRDRKGDTYQALSDEVAYIKLSTIKLDEVKDLVERARGKTGLVIDIRNYPGAFVVFELGTRLITESRSFARSTRADPSNPGAFIWGEPRSLDPITPAFEGKVAILVDEVSQSQAEYTAMALRVSPRAIVVGSTTAGADGNISPIPLPGGLRTMISGIGVFYPDKTPTQRIGIVVDIEATPTIDGIRAGRDEVLEAALRHILGADTSDDEIRAIARRP